VKGFSGRRDYLKITDLSDLVNLHGKAVYGFCHCLTKNKADTDDLYQETFLKAAELCHKIDKGNNTKGFLVSIAIGLWKNNRRKYARRQRIAPTEEFDQNISNDYIQNESSPEYIVISNELRNIIQAAVKELDYKLRIPLYMYYTAEMSSEDIAHALKIPQGTVKSRLYKARRALKNILEVSGYEKF
jgi:RNA polymerase sigma-70 factor (ECF subfamily)